MRGFARKGVYGLVLALLLFVSMGLAFAPQASAQNGLLGEYYNNTGTGASPPPPPGSPMGTTFTGAPVLTRIDAIVDFNPFATPPGPGINQDDFMIAWSGRVTATATGNHTFGSIADDGTRVWVNGTLLFDNWVSQSAPATPQMSTATIALTAGTPVTVRVEFYEDGGAEVCSLYWQPPGAASPVVIPTTQLTPPPPPAAPVLTATGGSSPTGAPQVVLSWTASAGATSYNLERRIGTGAFSALATGLTTTTYTDNAVAFGTTYGYRVFAIRQVVLISPASNIASATPMPPATGGATGSGGGSNNLAHRCGCSSIGELASFGSVWGAALLALALAFMRRR